MNAVTLTFPLIWAKSDLIDSVTAQSNKMTYMHTPHTVQVVWMSMLRGVLQ